MIKPLSRYGLWGLIVCGFVWLTWDGYWHIVAEIKHRDGYIQLSRGYPRLANASFKRATELMPWEDYYRLQLAKSYEKSAEMMPESASQYTQLAIDTYADLIANDPMNPWYKARLGIIYYELYTKNPTRSDYNQKAHDLAKAATDVDPQNPLFTLHYAHLLYAQNRRDLATEYYQKTLAYDDDLMEAHLNLAAIYMDAGDVDTALGHYMRICNYLDANPPQTAEDARAMQALQYARIAVATHYLNTNQPTAAIAIIETIPLSVQKYELLARYYRIIGEPVKAIAMYEQLNKQLQSDAYTPLIQDLKQP
jgi:tetratricopeptide (TPR) repeat protein